MFGTGDDYTSMNPKKSTRSKRAKKGLKIEAEDGGTEIFVLPPQLLQKLGINLANIVSPEEAPFNNTVGNESTDVPNCSKNNDQLKPKRSITSPQNGVEMDTTILQTASLMKESVFLSPSFTPVVANMPGELEIAFDANYQKFTSELKENVDGNAMNIKHHLTEADSIVTNSHHKSEFPTNFGKIIDGKIKDVLNDNRKQELDGKVVESVAQDTENVVLEILELTDGAMQTDDHPDEAYSSDCSNPELAWMSQPENATDVTNTGLNNKISIISEQILSPSQFKELKYLHNHNSRTYSVHSIPLNSLITNKYPTNDDNNQNVIGCCPVDVNKPQQNPEYINKETDSTGQSNFQNAETILVYDDKGVIINPENCNRNVEVDFPVHIIRNESLTLDEKYTVAEEILGKVGSPGELNADNNFDVCIDFNVSDIEKHLEENEEILESFVNDITGSDAHKIIENIENSEKACSEKPHDTACIEFDSNSLNDICQLKSYKNRSVNKYEVIEDKLAVPGDCNSKINNSSSMLCDLSEELKMVQGYDIANQIVPKYNAATNTIAAPQGGTDSISKQSKNKSGQVCEGDAGAIIVREHNQTDCANPMSNDQYNSDKVEEIAILLHQFTRCKLDLAKPLCKSVDNIRLRTKCHKVVYKPKSKMHIQGVEKPGGSESDDNVKINKIGVKTYRKSNKPKKIPDFTIRMDKVNNELSSINERSQYTQESVSIAIKANFTNDFCLCKDFGSLTCYEDERLYEHIHFLEHKKINCDSQFLFSIYDEDIVARNEKVVDQELEQETSPTSEFSICWNNLLNSDITDVKMSGGNDMACDEINRTNDHFHDINIPPKLGGSDDVSNNINLNTVEQNNTNEMVSKSSESSNRSSVEIDASVINESEFGEQIRMRTPSCEVISNIDFQINQSDVKIVPDQMKDSNQATIEEHTVGTEAYNNPAPKNDEGCQISQNVQINLASCSKSDNEHNSLRPVNEQSAPMEVETNMNSQTFNEIRTEVCEVKATLEVAPEETSQNEKMKEGKKRRKSLIITKTDLDNSPSIDEPPIKKSVKCGVCQELLAEEEWDEHSDTSHCFIAWRAEETIDLEDLELTKKLQIRLKSNSLKCPFCDFKNKRVKFFLSHVTECIKPKIPDISSGDTPNPKRRMTSKKAPVETAKSNSIEDNLVKCEVCQQNILDSNWIDHIAREHNYLAWKEGETSLDLDDEKVVREHLKVIVKKIGKISCSKCDYSYKNIKSYLSHVEKCEGSKQSLNNAEIENITKEEEIKEVTCERSRKSKVASAVICAVCSCSIKDSVWIEHIAKEHNYLAWKEGEEPLDITNEEVVQQYLSDILKDCGCLICYKCGYSRKNAKLYINHVKKCIMQSTFNTKSKTLDSSKLEVNTTAETENMDISTLETSISKKSELNRSVVKDKTEQCGVCKEEVKSDKWMDHIEKKHEYLAWKEGHEPLNLENDEQVYNHLNSIVKEICGLKCPKCGLVRKYVKSYLQHTKICKNPKSEEMNVSPDGSIVCGVCSEMVPDSKWKNHAMTKHYNVAWRVGETPIDMNNSAVAERLIKEYREQNKLVCKICKISRASCVGFYAHILTCGKTDEETEKFKSLCEICNKQYLTIYHRQHMAAHTAQEIVREQKLKKAEQKELLKNKEPEAEVITSGPRRAALKARSVIENYKVNLGAYACSSCGFDANSKDQLKAHKCTTAETFSDSEESVKIGSVEESSDSEIDSNISEDDESQARKKRSHKSASSRTQRLPFHVKHPTSYVVENSREFCKFHFTNENLFPDLYNLRIDPVPEKDLPNYMPLLEESCKVKFGGDWETYKRFEAKDSSECSLFSGASIQCMSWVPSSDDTPGAQFLTIVCHNGADAPRLEIDETSAGPGLVQIWSFGNFQSVPQFVFGLAHDLGTVWAIDWCPSGANDTEPQTTASRLGLLAIASSTGSAYIFSVPNPCMIENRDNLIYKMQPVLEMRLSMTNENKKYQATSINWSPQKGHSVIVVGYGDGTVAYYDLHNESPLLRTTENNITVVYPYHDERPHNCCVMDVDSYPSTDPNVSMGAVCTVGPTGCEMLSHGSVWSSRVRSRVPASGVSFLPLWPAATISGDDAVVNTGLNELQWWGGSRRVLCTLANAGCLHCTKFAYYSLPLLRVALPHPAYEDAKKITVGSIQMVSLGKKRKKSNDDLTVKIEPVTYDDVVTKYGIEFLLDSTQTPGSHIFREIYPERFPLADIKAMAFCRSATHHSKLAVATHAGIVFIVTV